MNLRSYVLSILFFFRRPDDDFSSLTGPTPSITMRGPSAKKASFKQQTSTLNPTRALVSQPARTPPPALPTLQEEASGLKFAAAQAGRQALGASESFLLREKPAGWP